MVKHNLGDKITPNWEPLIYVEFIVGNGMS